MKIGGLLNRYGNGKKIWLLFVLTNLVYLFMLTVTIPKVMGYTHGLPLLDIMPMGYSFEYVVQLFKNLGEKGRDAYLFQQLPIDMIYPTLFALTYSLLLAYVLKRMGKLHGLALYLCLLPFLAAMADYGENMGIFYLLKTYPVVSTAMVTLANLCTIVKSMATTFYFLVLFTALVWWVFKRFF